MATGKTMSEAAYVEAVLHMAHVALASATESATEHGQSNGVLHGMSQVVMLAGSGEWSTAIAWYDVLAKVPRVGPLRPREDTALWMVRVMLTQAAVATTESIVLSSISHCVAATADGETAKGREWLEHARDIAAVGKGALMG